MRHYLCQTPTFKLRAMPRFPNQPTLLLTLITLSHTTWCILFIWGLVVSLLCHYHKVSANLCCRLLMVSLDRFKIHLISIWKVYLICVLRSLSFCWPYLRISCLVVSRNLQLILARIRSLCLRDQGLNSSTVQPKQEFNSRCYVIHYLFPSFHTII